MFNTFAKFLLVATSLSPILGAVAVSQFSNGRSWQSWAPWLTAAIMLAGLCLLLLQYASKNIQTSNFKVSEFEKNDKEVVAFLIAYLLPFISGESMSFDGQWLTGAYVLVIIFLVVAHADAFHFNPIMGLMGYHFYGVKTEDGVSQLLISKDELRRTDKNLTTVRLARNIYLHIKKNETE